MSDIREVIIVDKETGCCASCDLIIKDRPIIGKVERYTYIPSKIEGEPGITYSELIEIGPSTTFCDLFLETK